MKLSQLAVLAGTMAATVASNSSFPTQALAADEDLRHAKSLVDRAVAVLDRALRVLENPTAAEADRSTAATKAKGELDSLMAEMPILRKLMTQEEQELLNAYVQAKLKPLLDRMGKASQAAKPAVGASAPMDALNASLALEPGGRPVKFRSGKGTSRGVEVEISILAQAELAPDLPGLEVVVHARPDEGYYGGNNYGSTLLVVGMVNGTPATIGTSEFTKYGSETFLEKIECRAGLIVATGMAIGPDDSGCCPCHEHRTVLQVVRTKTGAFALKQASRNLKKKPGPCGE